MNTPPPFSDSEWHPLASALLRQFAQGVALVETDSGAVTWQLCPWQGPLARLHLTLDNNIRNLAEHLVPADEAAFSAWTHQWPTPSTPSIQCRLVDPQDQSRSWLEFFVFQQGDHCLLIIHDLAPKTQLIQEEAESRRIETVETMAAGIAHEFNNSLTPVRGYLELGLDELGPNHPASEGLRTAISRVEHCAELIDQLQHYGRGVLLHRREANMAHLVRSLVHIGIAMFDDPASPVQLRENIDTDLPPVRIDHGRFREIIYQVLKNALAAMTGNKGILQVWANSVSSEDLRPHHNKGESDFIRLRFIDNGVGIEPAHMNRVFDPFFTTGNRAEKRGLGLSVAQGIVAQHGGWIELHSIKNQGTEVRIFLPAHTPASDPENVDPEEALPVKAAARPGRMLIADDESFIRQLVSRIFEQEGWLMDEAITHEEVIQLATRHPNYYQLIILDITMPGPSPEECVAEIARQSPKTRVVLMSGLQRASRIDQLLALGAKAFIPKPFSPKKLIGIVDEVLAFTSAPES